VKLDGIFLPVTTPFDPVTGDLDLGAFADNIQAWWAHPIAGVVVGGSTGEQALLDEEELLALVARASRSRPDGMALIAGAGAESTRATIRLCEMAAREGADAVLVKPPAYYRGRMSPEAIRTYFVAVANASPVPVILYHVPKFVPVEIVPELAGDLVRHENIAGIKDSSADIHNLGALCESVGERGTVVVGAGTLLYPGLEIVVQPSRIRCYSDQEYLDRGLTLSEDLSSCDLLMGVKEVEIDALIPDLGGLAAYAWNRRK